MIINIYSTFLIKFYMLKSFSLLIEFEEDIAKEVTKMAKFEDLSAKCGFKTFMT